MKGKKTKNKFRKEIKHYVKMKHYVQKTEKQTNEIRKLKKSEARKKTRKAWEKVKMDETRKRKIAGSKTPKLGERKETGQWSTESERNVYKVKKIKKYSPNVKERERESEKWNMKQGPENNERILRQDNCRLCKWIKDCRTYVKR